MREYRISDRARDMLEFYSSKAEERFDTRDQSQIAVYAMRRILDLEKEVASLRASNEQVQSKCISLIHDMFYDSDLNREQFDRLISDIDKRFSLDTDRGDGNTSDSNKESKQ